MDKRNIMSTTEKLTHKEKELIAFAASIASGCVPCTRHHLIAVRQAGASEADVFGAIGIALDVRDNATEMMAEVSLGNLNYEYPGEAQSGSMELPIDHLIAMGAALACNSVAGLEYYLAAAITSGASSRQIQTAVGIVRDIRKSAAERSEVRIESLIELTQLGTDDQPEGSYEQTDSGLSKYTNEDVTTITEEQQISNPPPCDCS